MATSRLATTAQSVLAYAKLDNYKVMVIGHQKGKTLAERQASLSFRLCSSRRLSQGDVQNENGGQVQAANHCSSILPAAIRESVLKNVANPAIAESMFMMARLQTPIICIVIGEGGSGGALGIGVGDKVAVLEMHIIP